MSSGCTSESNNTQVVAGDASAEGGSGGTGGSSGDAGSGATGGSSGSGGSAGGDAAVGGAAGSDGGEGDAASDGPAGVLRVFVTSALYLGDLKTAGGAANGPAGADALCTKAATDAGLGGNWVAWVSASLGAFDRVQGNGPWYRVDGVTLVFPDRNSLTGVPLVPIATDENGLTHTSNEFAWTGTKVGGSGTLNGTRCNGWTGGASGTKGNINAADGAWTIDGVDLCNNNNKNRLICFEQ